MDWPSGRPVVVVGPTSICVPDWNWITLLSTDTNVYDGLLTSVTVTHFDVLFVELSSTTTLHAPLTMLNWVAGLTHLRRGGVDAVDRTRSAEGRVRVAGAAGARYDQRDGGAGRHN